MVLFLISECGDVDEMPDDALITELLNGSICKARVQSFCTIFWSAASWGSQLQRVSEPEGDGAHGTDVVTTYCHAE